jgi:hypothetical protein
MPKVENEERYFPDNMISTTDAPPQAGLSCLYPL